MKDKNNNILKVGDSIKNKEGKKGKIENICGVTRLVYRGESGNIIQTIPFSKLDLAHFEKVVA